MGTKKRSACKTALLCPIDPVFLIVGTQEVKLCYFKGELCGVCLVCLSVFLFFCVCMCVFLRRENKKRKNRGWLSLCLYAVVKGNVKH